MSMMLDLKFEQRLLKCAGFYTGLIDGRWGPLTDKAETAFNDFFADTAKKLGTFDPRTEGNIRSLLPKAQIAARNFLNIAKTTFGVKILSGTRTYAEQDRLFAQTPRVTRARGGQSNHNFGIAWDIGVFVNGEYYDGADRSPARAQMEEQAYIDLAALIKPKMPELEWGGDWSGFRDRPHYQLAAHKDLSVVRAMFESGQAFV